MLGGGLVLMNHIYHRLPLSLHHPTNKNTQLTHLNGRPRTVTSVPTADSTSWARNMSEPNGSAGSGGCPGSREEEEDRCRFFLFVSLSLRCCAPSSPSSCLTRRSSW